MPVSPFTYTESTEIVPILKDARKLVAEHGWTQGSLFRGDCYCLEGAIRVAAATLGHHAQAPIIRDAMRVVCFVLDLPAFKIGLLFVWNDDPRRKAHDVVKALDDAVKHAPAIIAQCAAQAAEGQEVNDEP